MSSRALLELRARGVTSPPSEPGEVTLYVKGFLGRGEEPDHWERWLASHKALVGSHGWGERAVACRWPSGKLLTRSVAALGAIKGAVDAVRIVRNVRRAARLAHWGAMVAEELAVVAAHFAWQYVVATRNAEARADELAEHLSGLAADGARVRVVAHSLGCRHVIEGVSRLPLERRPHEIHLCAPASREEDVSRRLSHLARERTWVYYTRKDRVLDLAFTPVARGRALGHVGPAHSYAGLEALDVGEHFDFWVHGEYARRLPSLVPLRWG